MEDLDRENWTRSIVFYHSLKIYEWFWATAPSFVQNWEMITIRAFSVRCAIWKLADPTLRESTALFLKKAMAPGIVRQIEAGYDSFLQILFTDSYIESESFEVGKSFIGILLDLDVDISAFITKERERYSEWLSIGFYQDTPNRRIIVEYTSERGWVLGWEWVFDDHGPGFLVFSEFSTLSEACYGFLHAWPFEPHNFDLSWDDRKRISPKWMNRLSRRMAAKSRKELKRSGQRRPRSKMPGSWIK